MYPIIEVYEVGKLTGLARTYGGAGDWFVRKDFGDSTESEDCAVRAGRSFRTRKQARAACAEANKFLRDQTELYRSLYDNL